MGLQWTWCSLPLRPSACAGCRSPHPVVSSFRPSWNMIHISVIKNKQQKETFKHYMAIFPWYFNDKVLTCNTMNTDFSYVIQLQVFYFLFQLVQTGERNTFCLSLVSYSVETNTLFDMFEWRFKEEDITWLGMWRKGLEDLAAHICMRSVAMVTRVQSLPTKGFSWTVFMFPKIFTNKNMTGGCKKRMKSAAVNMV